MQIGIIADTHRKLGPKAMEVLEGLELILHLGDVGQDEVPDALNAIAGHSHKPRNEWIGDMLYFN